MAWEEFERNNSAIVSGDAPIDEMALSLKKIVTIYEECLGRKPKLDELMYVFETVICSQAELFVSDPDGLLMADFIVEREQQ